ncbi:MAG: DoxX family protein [Segetibacter sp.]|jgi:putative oxidoreductase|nr:DoxX family protein [Segetibacter sp.]
MKKIIATNANNWAPLIARLALGITILPHGAQKLLGMFGGYGFTGTMGFLTTQVGLPYVVALFVILIEFFASLLLIFGFLTRVAALGFVGLFTGVVLKVHLQHGFFMNWTGTQKGEGVEFFILLFGLAIILLITGGGKASVDAGISNNANNSPRL